MQSKPKAQQGNKDAAGREGERAVCSVVQRCSATPAEEKNFYALRRRYETQFVFFFQIKLAILLGRLLHL